MSFGGLLPSPGEGGNARCLKNDDHSRGCRQADPVRIPKLFRTDVLHAPPVAARHSGRDLDTEIGHGGTGIVGVAPSTRTKSAYSRAIAENGRGR